MASADSRLPICVSVIFITYKDGCSLELEQIWPLMCEAIADDKNSLFEFPLRFESKGFLARYDAVEFVIYLKTNLRERKPMNKEAD